MSLLKKFELVDCDGEDEVLTSNSKVLDIEPSDEKGCSQRWNIVTNLYKNNCARGDFLDL
jgi:hypothetical protein